MTSCRRYDLFKQTVNSIMNHWSDSDLKIIDYWFCVDDNSSKIDRQQMTQKYPWIDFYMKKENEKGHIESMNIIWNKLNTLRPEYWIHIEDDFLFHDKMDYITSSIEAFSTLKKYNVKQILFNRNYGETIEDCKISGHLNIDSDFVLHDHKIVDNITYPNCHYWKHYSFRPSITCVDAILDIGDFSSTDVFFEGAYAEKWNQKGYKSAFFNKITNRHIGRLTRQRDIKNAYELNDVAQF